MPDLNPEQLAALVRIGTKDREIVAALGRPMTAEERAAVDRARVVWRLRRSTSKTGPASAADRGAKAISEHSKVDRGVCENPARRKRLERNPVKWLQWYLAEAYPRPFETPHLGIINGAFEAHRTGGRFAVAAERGIGKSTLFYGIVLLLKLSGRCMFPIYVPWAQRSKSQAFRFWKRALCFNDRIAADYPEVANPFRHAKGVPQRVATTTWRDTGDLTHARISIVAGTISMPDNIGCMGSDTINGNPRGLNHTLPDGRVIRPDLVLLDDVQDRQTATSVLQIQHIIDVIDNDVGALGEAGADLPMLMSGNCIAPDDVMAHYLASREWKSMRVPCVEAWPEGWDDEKSACRKLWEEWYLLFSDDREGAAVKFYRAHKEQMTRGMRLSAPSAFRSHDKARDPLYGAMRVYHKMGRNAFLAERQQDPQRQTSTMYRLDRQTILARRSGYPRLEAPAASTICCGIDINYVGFNWSVVAADGLTRARRVVAHGIWPARGGLIPKGATNDQACALIRRGIGVFAREVLEAVRVKCGDKQLPIECAGFDLSNGKWQEAGVAAIQELRSPVKVYPLKAFAASNYRSQRADVRAGKGWRITEWPRLGKVLVINADYWRELMQRGFLVEPTEAGALSLYWPDPAGDNDVLAREVAGEVMIDHTTKANGIEYYTWARKPGVLNDRSDSLVYACALTGVQGIGEDKIQKQRKRYTAADFRR